jgi:hypothetical protein
MRFSTRLLLAVLASAFACASASAAFQATLPDGSGDRPWEIIAVEFPLVSGDVDVSVRDARGGPEVVRRVPGNSGRTWLPLPLVAPSEMTGPGGGIWPIEVILRTSESVINQALVPLILGQGSAVDVGPRLAAATPVAGFDGVCIAVSDQEILAGPALVFAGCDWVFLSPDLQARITQERALELLALGTRLVAPADGVSGPPGSSGGGLAPFLWESTNLRNGNLLWMTAAGSVPRPPVIEPDLKHIQEAGRRQAVPAGVRTALLLSGPLAAILLVFKWGLFHRRRAVLVSSAFSMVALTGLLLVYLHAHGMPQEITAQWRQAAASDQKPVGGLMLEERLAGSTPLFSTTVDIQADAHHVMFPVAATIDQYWALRGVQLRFDGGTHLCGTLPARGALWRESRTADVLGLLPAYPRTAAARARLWDALHLAPTDAWWLIGGYVKSAETPDEPGVLLTAWAPGKPGARGRQPDGGTDRMAWYNLRFASGHRYLLWQPAGIMNVLDFGPPLDAARESRSVP